MRCTTRHGRYRCDSEAGHGGECETSSNKTSPTPEEHLRAALDEATIALYRVAMALAARRLPRPEGMQIQTLTDLEVESIATDAFAACAKAIRES